MNRKLYRLLSLSIVSLLPLLAIGDELNLRETAMQIQELILAEKYEDAEPLAKKCLKQSPRDLLFLSQLDMSLNGQKKLEEAEALRKQIHDIWEKDHKEKWIADGSPRSKATWARMIVQTKNYTVIGTQYFQPEVLGTDFPITSYYKIIAKPKSSDYKTRIFKLEMSNLTEKFHVLRESYNGGGQQIIPYGNGKPEFYKVVKDAQSYLEAE